MCGSHVGNFCLKPENLILSRNENHLSTYLIVTAYLLFLLLSSVKSFFQAGYGNDYGYAFRAGVSATPAVIYIIYHSKSVCLQMCFNVDSKCNDTGEFMDAAVLEKRYSALFIRTWRRSKYFMQITLAFYDFINFKYDGCHSPFIILL